MKVSVVGILVLVVCIVVANLALVGLRELTDLPWDDGIESAVASGIGALIWTLVLPMVKR